MKGEAESDSKAAQFEWTPERVEMLTTLAAEGHSGGVIAEKLGCGLTRSAVIGKASRLGVSLHGRRPSKPKLCKKPKEPERAPEPIKLAPFPPSAPVPASVATLRAGAYSGEVAHAVINLESHHCKYPIGETNLPGFHFCGAHRQASGPYCPTHTKQTRQLVAKSAWYEKRRKWAEANPGSALARRVLREIAAAVGAGA